MKRYIKKAAIKCMIAFLLISNLENLVAQDTLKFRTGDLLLAKVVEITPKLVKYKKVGNESGPTYSNLKNDIEYIIYKNGQKEFFEFQQSLTVVSLEKKEFQPSIVKKYPPLIKVGGKFSYENILIGNRDMYNILLSLNDKKINSHIRLAKEQKAWQYIGFGAIPCGVSALLLLEQSSYSRNASDSQEKMSTAGMMAILGVACISTSITMKVKRNKNEAAALKLYQLNY